MSREEVFIKINEVFRDTFDDESITVNDATVASDIEGWNSLAHVGLLVNVEECFGIRFSMGEASTMKNVGEMVDVILKKLGN